MYQLGPGHAEEPRVVYPARALAHRGTGPGVPLRSRLRRGSAGGVPAPLSSRRKIGPGVPTRPSLRRRIAAAVPISSTRRRENRDGVPPPLAGSLPSGTLARLSRRTRGNTGTLPGFSRQEPQPAGAELRPYRQPASTTGTEARFPRRPPSITGTAARFSRHACTYTGTEAKVSWRRMPSLTRQAQHTGTPVPRKGPPGEKPDGPSSQAYCPGGATWRGRRTSRRPPPSSRVSRARRSRPCWWCSCGCRWWRTCCTGAAP